MTGIPYNSVGVTIEACWKAEGQSWEATAEAHWYSPDTMAVYAKDFGFVRETPGGRFSRAPCIDCETAYDRDQITDRHRCRTCADIAGEDGYQWGDEPTTERGWMALELEAWHARRRQDWNRMARPYTRLPESAGGGVPMMGGMLR